MSGTVAIPCYSNRGTIHYTPSDPILDDQQTARLPSPPCRPRQRRPHSVHITRLPAGFIPFDLRPQPSPAEAKKDSRFRLELGKLASRESAKRVLGAVFHPSFFSNSDTTTPSSALSSAASSTRSASPETFSSTRSPSFSATAAEPPTLLERRLATRTNSGVSDPAMARPSVVDHGLGGWNSNSGPLMPPKNGSEREKPICSGNGVSCYIWLAEPVIYLAGLDHDGTTRDSSSNTSAILRGKLQLVVTKSAKIKSVTLKFTGKARTEWAEGIPPDRTQTYEESSLRNEHLPFFNATFEGSETGYGTLCSYSFRDKGPSSSVTNLSSTTDLSLPNSQQSGFSLPLVGHPGRSNRSSISTLTGREQKRLSLQSNQSRSFQKGDSPFGPTPQQKGYKTFHPGVYEYSFELPIDNNSPETIDLPMARVKWQLEATVERAGTFKANLQGIKEIPVIRSPSEDSLELVEPISISRRWEDQLQYEIMISGKSFPIGSKIPIAFKLTPLAKVQVHKIKVYVSENVEYFTNNKKVTRKEMTRKLLLIEKVAGKPLSKDYAGSDVNIVEGGEAPPEVRAARRERVAATRERIARARNEEPVPLPEQTENLLGDIELGEEAYFVQTEMEMNVQLPTCETMAKFPQKALHPDCTWKCASVHHWIKILMRISRVDHDDPTGKKRRHFEISIDSPFTILSCRATPGNLALPEYSGRNANAQEQQRTCGCPNAAPRNGSPRSTPMALDPTLDNMPAGSTNSVPGLARPPQAHLNNPTQAVQRPIHLLRQPSFNPPPFDAEEPPPPIPTPPPTYDAVFTPSTDGLQDYFTRYNHEYEDTDDDDDRAFSRGRVNVPHPRTPGGRVARSMDIEREFMLESSFDTLRLATIRSQETGTAI
ncbi:putative arrestin-related trafficking adapter [Lachnellula occidentalis]|uniref:Putative arrestin-related trafficking adapter n=1 Tax=Lachnellula occidentalis TaxID=215460 RepID=A0A8H8S4I3_9HELO|nr:putative arrestin-related trafficking adapter [Lachnellula occidentalis]